MPELDELELNSSPEPTSPESTPPSRFPLWAIIVIVLLLGAALGLYYLRSRAVTPEIATAPPAETDATRPTIEPAVHAREPLELPELNASDEFIRQWVGALSEHPRLASVLVGEDLARRFVAAIDNIAEGASPRPHLGALQPRGELDVVARGDRLVIDPASYRRFDGVAAAIGSLDTEGTLQLYTDLEPLFDEAYQDLGYPNRPFRPTLLRAIHALLAVPVTGAGLEVTPKVSSYQFSDPALESLSDAQKNLLRMGPTNARIVQEKLRELGAGLQA